MSTSPQIVLVDCIAAPRAQTARTRLSSALPDADASPWQTLPEALLALEEEGGAPGESGVPGEGGAPGEGRAACLVLMEFAHEALAAAMAEGRPPRAALAAWMKQARDTLALCESHRNARLVTPRQAESDPIILALAARHLDLPLGDGALAPAEGAPNDPIAIAFAQATLSLERRARELNAGLIKAALLDDPVRRADRPDPDRAYKAYRALAADAVRGAGAGEDQPRANGAAEAMSGPSMTAPSADDGPQAGVSKASESASGHAADALAGDPEAAAQPAPFPTFLAPATPAEGDYRVRFDATAGDKILIARLAEVEARNEVLIDQVAALQDALHRAVVDPVGLAFETIFCDEAFNHPAFHGTERRSRDALPFRWFGREAEAVLRTTVPRTRPVCVEAYVAVAIRPSALERFEIHIADEAPIAREVSDIDDGAFLVRFFFEAADVDPLTRVALVLTAGDVVDLSGSGDARTLAVGLHKITVSQLEELPAAYRQSPQVEMTAEEALDLPAFYGAEMLSGVPFRWMGREDDAVLRANVDCRGPMVVEVHMPVVMSQACLEAVTLSLNGLAPDRQTIEKSEGGTVVAAFFAMPPGAHGGATVVLSAPEKVDMQGSDTRALSVAVHKVVVKPLDPSALEPA